jgi:16S rRNA (adenine1518-N6/adenine1519-N6)-dimethyltransferase
MLPSGLSPALPSALKAECIVNPRDILGRLGIEPKKSLGQNFMVTPGALQQMADAAGIGPDDAVLEIGAGLGALTEALAGRARRVVAVELDERFIPHLRRLFDGWPQVEIVHGDALTLDPAALMGPDAPCYRVAANLPYYITSALIRHLLESSAPPVCLALTVQREVAERVTARPGAMSLLAVSVQFYGQPELVARLKPGAFYPRPDVESAILRITPHASGPLLPPAETSRFFRMVRAGFSQRRKQIKNSLAAGLRLPVDSVVNWLAKAGIDPQVRAETLAMEDWLALHAAFGPD